MRILKVAKCTRKWLYTIEERADRYNASAFGIGTLEKSLCLITGEKSVGLWGAGAGINEAGVQDSI